MANKTSIKNELPSNGYALCCVWPKRLHRLVSRLSKLQDEIGLDHDAAVLRGWLKKTPENFGGSETVRRVVGCLDSQTQKLRKPRLAFGD